ncbi:MAG: hypothetical protein GXP24_02280 [Planctomycetes bacterium]|nr:hypothetical protein [Planctomycetota bacterium]
MRTLMNLLVVCAVFGMMSANAFAGGGGGGAKDDGSIVVKNDGGGDNILLVVVGDLGGNFSLTNFLAAGGQIVEPGDTASFDVPAGSQTVTAVFIGDVSLLVTGTGTAQPFNVGKNQTVNVSATIAGGNTALN